MTVAYLLVDGSPNIRFALSMITGCVVPTTVIDGVFYDDLKGG